MADLQSHRSDSASRDNLQRAGSGRAMDHYVSQVVRDWELFWRERKDHRYGKDFHAFLGERVLTDFDLRHHDRTS